MRTRNTFMLIYKSGGGEFTEGKETEASPDHSNSRESTDFDTEMRTDTVCSLGLQVLWGWGLLVCFLEDDSC